MPLLDITDPAIIRFLTESYEKESLLRMRWVQLNSDSLEKCATFKSDVKNYTEDDIAKAKLVAGIDTIKRDHIESMRYRVTAPLPDYMCAEIKYIVTAESKTKMMPIKDEVKHTLLESRKKYLKTRGKEGPADKYYFIESNNWMYGWKLNESEMKMRGPVHGRVSYTTHDLHSHVGPQPDPSHYGSSVRHAPPCFV